MTARLNPTDLHSKTKIVKSCLSFPAKIPAYSLHGGKHGLTAITVPWNTPMPTDLYSGALTFLHWKMYRCFAGYSHTYNAAYYRSRLVYYAFLSIMVGTIQLALGECWKQIRVISWRHVSRRVSLLGESQGNP